MSSTASFRLSCGTTVAIRRAARARGLRLAVDPRDGTVRLTLPPRAALRSAAAWAESKRGWIADALAAVPPARPIRPGATIPYEDRPLLIDWAAAHPRAPRRDGDRLRLGGPEELVAARVRRWLRAEALRVLTAETSAMAAQAGVTIAGVGVGDARGRWGSCTTSGVIRYSWRLILAPPAVRTATVAHEVAHRLHMDHSPAFHAAVARLLGHAPTAERAWLRQHGAALHRVGAG